MPTPPAVPTLSRLARARRSARRSVLRHRRLLAAVALAVAVIAGLRVVAPPEPPSVEVVVAAADLPTGTVLGADDLRTVAVPPEAAPAAVVAAPSGRTLAAPLRAGEPVTDVRLVGPSLTEGQGDDVAVPVRLPDGGAVGLLAVGDEIDLVAADPRGEVALPVATDAHVLAVPADDAGTSATGLPGRLVVLGLDPAEVDDVARATVVSVLTYTW